MITSFMRLQYVGQPCVTPPAPGECLGSVFIQKPLSECVQYGVGSVQIVGCVASELNTGIVYMFSSDVTQAIQTVEL